MMSSSSITTMNNTQIIVLNNAAIDALHAGDVAKGFQLLSNTFHHSVQNHRNDNTHNLTPRKNEADDGNGTTTSSSTGAASGLAFSLQDCSRNLVKVLLRTKNRWADDDDASCCHSFLSLNFLRIDILPDTDTDATTPVAQYQGVNELCHCAVAWALGYNLSLAYALIGFQKGRSRTHFKKSLRVLAPIKRQVMLLHRRGTSSSSSSTSCSPFWTNLKLCILNNYICINSELSQNQAGIASSVRAMGGLLVHCRDHVDPMDVEKFYRSIQLLNVLLRHNPLAAAA